MCSNCKQHKIQPFWEQIPSYLNFSKNGSEFPPIVLFKLGKRLYFRNGPRTSFSGYLKVKINPLPPKANGRFS